MECTIRPIRMDDAEAFWQMMFELDFETKYMLYEPNERVKNMERIRGVIDGAVTGGDLLLVAEADGEIVGYISAQRGSCKRIKHSAYIVVGIRAAYRGQGVGGRFFAELDRWAAACGVSRLELTVMCNNATAKHLYEKHGFVVEGTKVRSMLVDGEFVDEYYMAKIVSAAALGKCMLFTAKIEQTYAYKNRMKYEAASDTFVDEGYPSLFYSRNVREPYGWITESGAPPRAHLDVIVMSDKQYKLGDEERIKIIGVFRRSDGDNKLVGVPEDRNIDDFSMLTPSEKEDMHRLYPHEGAGEGWFGREAAERVISEYFNA